MKILRFLLLSAFGFSLPTVLGCGSSGNTTALTISPVGPTIVLKGDTLQFTASRTDVIWSIQGGSANGTISTSGIYSTPGTLPASSPSITVQVQSSDGQSQTASVDLRAGDTLSFGPAAQVSGTAIPTNSVFIPEEGMAGVADRLSVRLGTVQEDSIFSNLNGGVANLFYSQSLDFAPFSMPANLSNDNQNTKVAITIETDSNENPGIIFADLTTGHPRLMFTGSSDQGMHFNAPVPLTNPLANPGNDQSFAFLRLDAQDALHVVFSEQDNSVLNGTQNIFYVSSVDGGVSWSNPVPVNASATDDQQLAALAVDPAGIQIFICWQDLPNKNILFAASNNAGATFGTPIPLTTSNNAQICRVGRGPSGNIYVAYGDGLPNPDIFLRASSDDGVTFSPAAKVNSSSPINFNTPVVMMSVDDMERIDFVWSTDVNSPNDGDADTLMYSRSLDGGATFSQNTSIASGTAGSSTTGSILAATGLKHDRAGRLYVQYFNGGSNQTTGQGDIFVLEGE